MSNSKSVKAGKGKKPMQEVVTVTLVYTKQEHRCLSAVAAIRGKGLEDYLMGLIQNMAAADAEGLHEEVRKVFPV